MLSAAEVIQNLSLTPHPEGGHFRETFHDARTVDDTRAASTAIYFLLARAARLADGGKSWRLDTVRLHRRARFRV